MTGYGDFTTTPVKVLADFTDVELTNYIKTLVDEYTLFTRRDHTCGYAWRRGQGRGGGDERGGEGREEARARGERGGVGEGRERRRGQREREKAHDVSQSEDLRVVSGCTPRNPKKSSYGCSDHASYDR